MEEKVSALKWVEIYQLNSDQLGFTNTSDQKSAQRVNTGLNYKVQATLWPSCN